jgi:hypothetical protein
MGALSIALLALGAMPRDAAVADETVPTGANIVTGSMPPTIECKWELPDTDRDASNGVQYGNDDAPSTQPTPAFPCDLSAGGAGKPAMADGATHMIQVRPNAEDLPTERLIELWAAVDHDAGISNISDVYWKIFHPDGSFKTQVHGVRVACEGPAGMFAAANVTGQLTSRAINDVNNGIIALCQQGVKAIYRADFEVSKHQPSGAYKIELHAVSVGAEAVLTNYLDIVPFFNLVTDFTGVDFGKVVAGQSKSLAGDLDMTTATRPTVKNTGNSGMGLGVRFSTMLQCVKDTSGVCVPVPGAKIIDQFDAAFGRTPATIQAIDPIAAGARADFDSSRHRVLCPNRIGKLDFSVHPPSTLPASDYAGSVEVLARSVPICRTDEGHVSPLTVEDPDPALHP